MSISRPGSDDTLGKALVANGTMSQEELDFALMLKDGQPDKYLGEILIQIGIPQEKINKALYYSNKRKTIGEILIDQGLISSAQLEDALSKQRHIKNTWELTKTLGQLLIEMGYIKSHGLLTALSKQELHAQPRISESYRQALRQETEDHCSAQQFHCHQTRPCRAFDSNH
jgi:hypothetical protein